MDPNQYLQIVARHIKNPQPESNWLVISCEDYTELLFKGFTDGKPTPFEGIHAYLKPRLEKNQTKPVIIRPEPNAAYGDMVRVYDLLRQIKLLEGKLVVREDVEPITDERWNGAKELNISIPTQREIDQFWY